MSVLLYFVPRSEISRSLCKEGSASSFGATEEELTHFPFADVDFFNRNIFNLSFTGTVAHAYSTTEQFSHDTNLATALFKATQVEQTRRDDLSRTDARNAANGEKNVAFAGDFGNHSHNARARISAFDDENIANLANAVSVGIEDRAAHQSGDEYS